MSRFSAFVLKIVFLFDLTSSICRDDRTSDLKPKAAIRLIELEKEFRRHSSFSLFLSAFSSLSPEQTIGKKVYLSERKRRILVSLGSLTGPCSAIIIFSKRVPRPIDFESTRNLL